METETEVEARRRNRMDRTDVKSCDATIVRGKVCERYVGARPVRRLFATLACWIVSSLILDLVLGLRREGSVKLRFRKLDIVFLSIFESISDS